MAEETTDAELASREEDDDSVSELLEQLVRELGALGFHESRLAAARHKPELLSAGRDLVTALAALAAFLTAFVLATTAALLALSNVMAGWLAALVLASAWTAIGIVLGLSLWVRARRAGQREGETVEEASERAEQAVRVTLARLGPAITKEIALAAVPTAGGIAELGEDLLEGADELVDAVTEELPGGGVVNQVWDVVLAPGRFGIRVATTVLKRGEPES